MLSQPLLYTLILLGGLQGVLLGLLHALRPTSRSWTRWLGGALAIHALSDIFLWAFWTRDPIDLRLLILFPVNVILLPVYLLFQYVRSFTQAEEYPGPAYRTFLAVAAGLEIIVYLIPAGATLYTGHLDDSLLLFAKSVRTRLNLASLPVVLATGLVLLRGVRRYQRAVPAEPAYRAQVSWLYQLLAGLGIVYGLALLPMLVQLTDLPRSRAWFYPLGLASSLYLAWVGSRAFWVHERFCPRPAGKRLPAEEVVSPRAGLYEQALRLIEGEQLYKQPSLKLSDVAGRLSVSPHHLSRVINEQAHKNFNDLINELRVAEVKRLMSDPAVERYTLEGLGRQAGFGAKSTYQAAFKRLTGLTPSQYRDQARPES